MGKSILVIDTPESCQECRFRYLGNYGHKTCLAKDRTIFLDGKRKKPDWCPIQDAPRKKAKNPYHNQHKSGYVEGWNDCIGTILDSDDHKDSAIQAEKDCANCVCSSCSHKTECCEDCEGAIRDCEERNAPYT